MADGSEDNLLGPAIALAGIFLATLRTNGRCGWLEEQLRHTVSRPKPLA